MDFAPPLGIESAEVADDGLAAVQPDADFDDFAPFGPPRRVALLDEAHLLHQDVLDHLHILLNYQWDSKALLSLVLVGLPELEGQLGRRHHRSLFSRIHTRLRIDPLTPEDTTEYLRARLARVGCDRELFATDAIAMLHEAASGALRDVDRLATAALKETARRKKKLVERDVLARIVDAAVDDR